MGSITTTCAILLATAGSRMGTGMFCDEVDLIEINHCYDEKGHLVFEQLIFYDWSPSKSRYDVRDWRLIKDDVQMPRKDHRSGVYVAIWRDGRVLRKVLAKTVRETWTQYDPEVVEQAFLPKGDRQPLPKPPTLVPVGPKGASTLRR